MPFVRAGHFTVSNESGTTVKVHAPRAMAFTYADADDHKYDFCLDGGFDENSRAIEFVGWKNSLAAKDPQLSPEQATLIREEITEALLVLGAQEVQFN